MAFNGRKTQWTVLELLNWTAEHFRRAGVKNPRLNAEVLLGKVLGLERIMLYARFEEQVGQARREQFRELVRRRAAREPLQYLTGSCEFYGRQFAVGPAVMVPRQETELVVEKCLEKMPGDEAWVADVCTGSGVIAVTLAAERPLARLIATDSSAEALEVAAQNARKHHVEDRVIVALGELLEPVAEHVPSERKGVEVLVSNPPYVPRARIEGLEPEVRDYEPRAAIDGGPDGLMVIRQLVAHSGPLLARRGWLVLEIGEGQAEAVKKLITEAGTFASGTIDTATDAGGSERVVCVQASAQ